MKNGPGTRHRHEFRAALDHLDADDVQVSQVDQAAAASALPALGPVIGIDGASGPPAAPVETLKATFAPGAETMPPTLPSSSMASRRQRDPEYLGGGAPLAPRHRHRPRNSPAGRGRRLPGPPGRAEPADAEYPAVVCRPIPSAPGIPAAPTPPPQLQRHPGDSIADGARRRSQRPRTHSAAQAALRRRRLCGSPARAPTSSSPPAPTTPTMCRSAPDRPRRQHRSRWRLPGLVTIDTTGPRAARRRISPSPATTRQCRRGTTFRHRTRGARRCRSTTVTINVGGTDSRDRQRRHLTPKSRQRTRRQHSSRQPGLHRQCRQPAPVTDTRPTPSTPALPLPPPRHSRTTPASPATASPSDGTVDVGSIQTAPPGNTPPMAAPPGPPAPAPASSSPPAPTTPTTCKSARPTQPATPRRRRPAGSGHHRRRPLDCRRVGDHLAHRWRRRGQSCGGGGGRCAGDRNT